jgi:hypothetical protein
MYDVANTYLLYTLHNNCTHCCTVTLHTGEKIFEIIQHQPTLPVKGGHVPHNAASAKGDIQVHLQSAYITICVRRCCGVCCKVQYVVYYSVAVHLMCISSIVLGVCSKHSHSLWRCVVYIALTVQYMID